MWRVHVLLLMEVPGILGMMPSWSGRMSGMAMRGFVPIPAVYFYVVASKTLPVC